MFGSREKRERSKYLSLSINRVETQVYIETGTSKDQAGIEEVSKTKS